MDLGPNCLRFEIGHRLQRIIFEVGTKIMDRLWEIKLDLVQL